MTAKKATAKKMLTINQIAEETSTSAKRIRAYLRKVHARHAELKNSRWGDAKNAYVLSAELTEELLEHFTKVEVEAS